MVHQTTLSIATKGRSFTDLTARVADVVKGAKLRVGTCTLFIRHTSASLVIQENADPDVLADLQRWIDWAAAERPPFGAWKHDAEGPDDMPAHVRSVLTHTSEVIPIVDGRLGLGTWQAIYLWEHRTAPHTRQVLVTLIGE